MPARTLVGVYENYNFNRDGKNFLQDAPKIYLKRYPNFFFWYSKI